MRTSKRFATDGSKMKNVASVGFAPIYVHDDISWKLRIAKITSIFTA
jgi:hypothetical protein